MIVPQWIGVMPHQIHMKKKYMHRYFFPVMIAN